MDNALVITDEVINQNLEQYKGVMNRDYITLELLIDTLPKQALTRLVKMYSGCNLAREIAGVESLSFHQNEEKIIKKAMKLQDDCIGYLQLKKEMDEKQQGDSNGN